MDQLMRASKTTRERIEKRRPGVARLADLLRRRSRRESGFTILETTIALGILSVGILGVAASLLTSMKFSRRSRSMTQAMYLAEQQMEIFHLMPAADVEAMVGTTADGNNPIDPDPNDGDATTFNRSWTIALDDAEVDVNRMTLNVVWTDAKGIPRTVSLESLKSGF